MFKFHYQYRCIDNLPIIPIAFKSKCKTTNIIEGFIDTGSTNLLINHQLSDYLHLEPKNWMKNSTSASGHEFKTAKVIADLIIGHGHRRDPFKDVEIRVSEFNDYPDLPLIGRYPLFEWYNVNFDNEKNRVDLIPK